MAYTQDQLAQVEAAIIALGTGSRRVEIRFPDRTVRYSDTDLAALRALRDDMRNEIASAQADTAESRRPRMFRARTSRGL